jgi:Tol biopolymer transport system component
MGDVYRADDSELHRAVALKILPDHLVGDPDRLARFIQEARTASALNHPHVVAIYDIGQGTGSDRRPVHFIAMELVTGETLRALLDRRAVELRHALDYAAQAADALSAAHAAGIVHRDLKPENVMIADGGYVKILDFGLAKLKLAPSDALAEGLTMPAAGTTPGVVMGTVGYMSPEQAQGLAVDARGDVFSFGCILYEVVTGTRAFSGKSAVDTLHQIIHVDPRPIMQRASTPLPELQRIVQKCLQKDPDDRYQSMKEIAVDLRALRRQLDSGSAPAMPTPARRMPTWVMAALAIPVVMALAIVARVLLPRSTPARDATQPLSVQRLTENGVVIDAVISPDGTYLAYVESSGGRQTLYLRQLRGTRPIELMPSSAVSYWGITFARDGQSIYYALKDDAANTTGTLFQIPTLGGTPRRLLTDIESVVTCSPDRRRLAFYRIDRAQGTSSLVIANIDGSDAHAIVTKRPPEFLAPAFFVAPSWSPDGRTISGVVRNSDARETRVVTFDAASGAETSFSGRYAFATATAWLPDGSGILFVAVGGPAVAPSGVNVGVERTTGNGGQIYLQPYPSGPARRITSDVVEYRNISVADDSRTIVSVGFDAAGRLTAIPYAGGLETRLGGSGYDGTVGLAWAPDGRRIFFVHAVVGERGRTVMSANSDGTDVRDVTTDGTAVWPAISPDGTTLAYFGSSGGRFGIWRSGVDGTDRQLVTAIADAMKLAFAPDGRTVYFTSSMRGVPSTYRVNIARGEPELVAPFLEHAAVSHDGRRLAGVYRESARSPVALAVLDAQTAKPLAIFPNFTTISPTIAWTPDDKAVLYTTVERMNIWRRAIPDGREERVTSFSDQAVLRFAPSPDGKTLLMSRGSLTRDAFLIGSFR